MKGNLAEITTPGLRDRLGLAALNGSAQNSLLDRPAPRRSEAQPVQRGEPPFIRLGDSDQGMPYWMSVPGMLSGRALIQGSSGAGKSYALRRVIEQAHRLVTTVIVDPEGEFANLAAHIGAVRVSGAEMSTDALTAIAIRARRHRVSLWVDLSDVQADDRIEKAAAFFAGMTATPREDWRNTCLVFVDEAHLLAPHMAATSRDAEIRRLGVAALTDLCSRGRKRGVSVCIATQRLAKLAPSVRAELHNVLIGLNMLDRDVDSAADLLGWSRDKAGMLRDLAPGEFVGLGPAISSYPVVVRIGGTETEHFGATPGLVAGTSIGAVAARELLDLDKLLETPGLRLDKAAAGPASRVLDLFLLDGRAQAATRILGALIPISPNATTSGELAEKLGISADQVDAALDLLSQLGAVEAMPRANTSPALGGWSRIARLSARLRSKAVAPKVVGLA